MAVFPLSFKEVVVFLGSGHLIAIPQISKLEARIKDFQRRGFPPGLNTGKGRAAEYGADQVILLTFAFELLELGMTPEKICTLLEAAGREIVLEIANICRTGRGTMLKKNRTLVYFDPQGLSYLRDDGEHYEHSPNLTIGRISDLSRRFTETHILSSRIAVLDLYSLVGAILTWLEGAKDCSEQEAIDALANWACTL